MVVELTRRRFLSLSAFGCVALAYSHTGTGFSFSTAEQQLIKKPIRITDLPKAFDNYRIGFITDTHIGISVPIDWLEQAINTLRHHRVDLLLFGGDFVWLPESLFNRLVPIVRNHKFVGLSHSEMLTMSYKAITRILKDLGIKDGIYGVPGNHDNWYDPHMCRQLLQGGRFRLLINQNINVYRGSERLELIGFDDYWTGKPLFPATPLKKNRNHTRILLSHNPDLLSFLHHNSKLEFDLGLAGHTHGGQIRLPGQLGAIHYGIRDHHLADGFFYHGQTSFYTSRGLGVSGIPIRINCPAEITILKLLRA